MAATPLTIALGCGALAGVVAWSAFLAVRGPSDGAAPLDRKRRAAAVAAIASVALGSLGAKWWLVSEYATTVPFFDAWEGEGAQVYLRLANGDLRWSDILPPHNEHRIALQRLVGLGLLVANGQWDARLQMVVNAAVHVLAGVILLTVLWRQAGRRHLEVLGGLVLIAWALPLGWENTLAGFQLSFYLLILLFVLAIGLLPGAVPGSARWYLGVAALLLSLFTLGSGPANAVAVGVALALGWSASSGNRRDVLPGIIACLAVVILGIALAIPPRVGEGVQFEPIRRSLQQWMAWPASAAGASAVVTWMPLLVLSIVSLRRPSMSAPVDRTLIALGIWVALHGAAVAYGRGMVAERLAPRYSDILALGFVANGTAAVVLVSRPGTRRVRALGAAAVVAWGLWTVPGLAGLAREAHRDAMPVLGGWYRNHVANLRRFIETGDMTRLAAQSAPLEIPHPNASLLAAFVTHERFRPFLPPDLQRPLKIEPSPGSTPGAFVPDGIHPSMPRDGTRPSSGSFTTIGNEAMGRFESTLASCPAPMYSRIDVAGNLGGEGTDLRLVTAEGSTVLRVTTRQPPREAWQPVFVRCPAAPFALVADDRTPEGWIAFRHPVVYGPLSVLALGLAGAWKTLVIAAAALALFAVASRTARFRR